MIECPTAGSDEGSVSAGPASEEDFPEVVLSDQAGLFGRHDDFV